jgi:hypothetical protein
MVSGFCLAHWFATLMASFFILSYFTLSEMRCSVHSFVIVLIEVAVNVSDEGAPPLPVESELVLSECEVFPVRRRGLPRDFHLLPQVVAEFHFARRMKFISHRWVLLHENEIAVKPAHTTLYCCLSLGRFRVVRTRATVILRLSAVRLNPSLSKCGRCVNCRTPHLAS